ncbi:molybdenum cofactor guanylyltransferase [Goodfellowiella coeruleoviolacea]|uniref:Molybdopterin-guanine dinucleotide biosynthesis protein A n=1 Tax=Goodfellowiella coeruleoviolacea TaxID=334858 RepID=A0AAE3G917_9PSEU|nr:NTP transferase domain-containing protein [Goodfellowiella coeruleoviolacea]MCP2163795.1 Molybdopterin-guanine dinucleotide biosynthesis protein A [Goodfellowiella coeruleoviolacea]
MAGSDTTHPDHLAAVLLAGGRASRLGGVDKAGLTVAGRTLLAHALTALRGADPVVVVGPRRPVPAGGPARLVWTREDPPGGGPVAGLAEGLRQVPERARLVALLAVDQPGVGAATLRRLAAALAATPGAAGAVLVDDTDRRQWLAGVWLAGALRAAVPADPAGTALRAVLGPLEPVPVPALPGEAQDVDTPADLERLRRLRG